MSDNLSRLLILTWIKFKLEFKLKFKLNFYMGILVDKLDNVNKRKWLKIFTLVPLKYIDIWQMCEPNQLSRRAGPYIGNRNIFFRPRHNHSPRAPQNASKNLTQ